MILNIAEIGGFMTYEKENSEIDDNVWDFLSCCDENESELILNSSCSNMPPKNKKQMQAETKTILSSFKKFHCPKAKSFRKRVSFDSLKLRCGVSCNYKPDDSFTCSSLQAQQTIHQGIQEVQIILKNNQQTCQVIQSTEYATHPNANCNSFPLSLSETNNTSKSKPDILKITPELSLLEGSRISDMVLSKLKTTASLTNGNKLGPIASIPESRHIVDIFKGKRKNDMEGKETKVDKGFEDFNEIVDPSMVSLSPRHSDSFPKEEHTAYSALLISANWEDLNETERKLYVYDEFSFVGMSSCLQNKLDERVGQDVFQNWMEQVTDINEIHVDSGKIESNDDYIGDLIGFIYGGSFHSQIVHEIYRNDWTWCTEWAPDGDYLAIATQNHGISIIETANSTVWKILTDVQSHPPIDQQDSFRLIRSISWGKSFIAVGGTGDDVSIIDPNDSFRVVNTICKTGFVGTLDWKANSNVLAIGSRENCCLIVKFEKAEGSIILISTVQNVIETKSWVNKVSFSPSGELLAIGDQAGYLFLYEICEGKKSDYPILTPIKKFVFDDAILDICWSPDGASLYVGGEDCRFTTLNTSDWKLRQRILCDRWVQCLVSSNNGRHVALGGGCPEVTFFDINNSFTPVKTIKLFEGQTISASWHPKDKYLAMSGQNQMISVVETSPERYISAKNMRCTSSISSLEFSPDGQFLAVGNQISVLSIFDTTKSEFVLIYELVIGNDTDGVTCLAWSPNGTFIVAGSNKSVVFIITPLAKSCTSQTLSVSGFALRKIIRKVKKTRSLSFSPYSDLIAISGSTTQVLDVYNQLECLIELEEDGVLTTAFSSDRRLLALGGKNKNVTIYHTDGLTWKLIFCIPIDQTVMSLVWGSSSTSDIHYLAFGGDNEMIRIIEFRMEEVTWESILSIEVTGVVKDLSWNENGLLAAALGNGNTSIFDLNYINLEKNVKERSYSWRRQCMTCSLEVRRINGTNEMTAIGWMPTLDDVPQDVIAIGGTDGIIEMFDLSHNSNG